MDIKTLSKKMRLSITTVSRALGGYSDVSEKTRKRVIRFAKKYNYSPNPYAKGLASGKSNVVGVVIPVYGINHSSLNQSHFFQFISGMTKTMIKDNIQFTMLFANSRKEEMQAFSNLIEVQKVDKFIINNTKTNDERIGFFKKKNVNFVSWGRTGGKNNFSWVDLDNELSSKLIVDFLVSKGHRNIGYISIIEQYNFASQRRKAFLESLSNHNIGFKKKYYASIKYEDPKLHKDVIKKMLNLNPEITSLVCSTEYSIVGAVNAVRELKRVVGKDISIVGYDGPIVSAYTSPSISAITHPLEKMGIKAIEMLFSTKKNQNYLVEPKFLDRGSVHKVTKNQ